MPCSDGSGTIIETGPGVDSALIGSDVVINPAIEWGRGEMPEPELRILGIGMPGTLAEYVTVPADSVKPIPEHMSFEEAAAFPLAGTTAYRALVRRGALRSGERLLITGIGGGVALSGLQIGLACQCGVSVTSSSDEKIRKAVALGAENGVNHAKPGWAAVLRERAGEFDIVLDSAGGETLSEISRLVRPGGRIVSVGITSAPVAALDVQQLFSKQLTYLGSMMGSEADFAEMLTFVSRHRIVPVVDRIVSLTNVNEAFWKLRRGEQFGKLVVTIDL